MVSISERSKLRPNNASSFRCYLSAARSVTNYDPVDTKSYYSFISESVDLSVE